MLLTFSINADTQEGSGRGLCGEGEDYARLITGLRQCKDELAARLFIEPMKSHVP